MSKMTRKEVMDCLGLSPDALGAELAAFTASAEVLSSDTPRLIDSCPNQWVAVFDGVVQAKGLNVETVMAELSNRGIPASQTIVRFIDNADKIFIL